MTKLHDLETPIDSSVHQGEIWLLKGDLSRASACFDEALKQEPNSATLLYRQGLAYFEYGSEKGKEKALLIACKKFKTAVALSSSLVEAWNAWGNTLFLLGRTSQEYHYFQDAESRYRSALDLCESQKYDSLAELYWDYGAVRMKIAEHSGEAVDIYSALDAFHQASSLQESFPADFWNDFGSAALNLAKQINDIRLHVKAINCFKQAVTISSNSFEGWANLGSALMHLYAQTHDEDLFSQANECFASAAQLRPEDTGLWLIWARFLLESGKNQRDIKRLRSSIEKCHRAYISDPNLPLTSAIWAEALAQIGEICDRVDLLYEAQNKIEAVAEKASDEPDILLSHGMCMLAFGRYFEDYDCYYQAIEKFQEGLSLDRTHAMLWHAIAKCYVEVGELEEDTESLEQALHFYAKSLDLNPSTYNLFDYATALAKLGDFTNEPIWMEEAIRQFERALSVQKNALNLHPDWLFEYASTLDLMGDHLEEGSYYVRAIEIFSHVLMIDPDFPGIHHSLGQAFLHMGEFVGESDHFFRALHHFRLAAKRDEEDDQVLLDLGLTLIDIAQRTQDASEADGLYREAEHKITLAAKLGNEQAYYHLGCLYSLLGQYDKSMRFLLKSEESKSLPPLEEILLDDWLDGVRTTPDFHAFLLHLEKKT